jgi:hypothetical protein
LTDHRTEREIKHEQHVIAPELPENPDALEAEKRQSARLIPIVIVAAALILLVLALLIL